MIDKLLPKIDELTPIKDSNNTFYECGFNDDFKLLPFEKQLQVICDIVRQSIYPSPFPNPKNNIEFLVGNCYTAAKISKLYLEKLNIGKNIKIVMGRARIFEPSDNTTTHMLNLVEDDFGNIYQFDATPFVGYGFGKVEKIENNYYQEYVELTEEIAFFINIFLEIIYYDYKNILKKDNIPYYLKMINESLDYNILNGYASKCLKIISNYLNNQDKQVVLYLSNKLNKYTKQNEIEYLYRKEMISRQIEIWKKELTELISSNSNIKRQSELAQNIIQEKKMLDSSFEKYMTIKGHQFRLSFINPRVLKELGLNTIMIKPSAYFIGKEKVIEERMLFPNKQSFGRYSIDLSKSTNDTNISPMLFSHPLGEDYIRSMMGTSTIMLVNNTSDNLNKTKRILRNELCGNMWNTEITWIDNEKILWHPYVTNLIHSADDYSESALHYLIGYPEHQAMTRFMYPNKKLVGK